MTDPAQVTVLGYTVNVPVVDGVPQCPCCHDPMVQVQPGEWTCPLGAALHAWMAEQSPLLDAWLRDLTST